MSYILNAVAWDLMGQYSMSPELVNSGGVKVACNRSPVLVSDQKLLYCWYLRIHCMINGSWRVMYDNVESSIWIHGLSTRFTFSACHDFVKRWRWFCKKGTRWRRSIYVSRYLVISYIVLPARFPLERRSCGIFCLKEAPAARGLTSRKQQPWTIYI